VRLFCSAAGTGTGTGAGTGREAAIVATAIALAGSGLGLWLKPPSLADSGEAVGGQISVAGGGAAEAREEKGRFLFAGERPVVPACVLLVCDLSVSVLAGRFNLIDGLARSGLWGFCCCGRRRRRRYCFVLVWLGLLLCIRMFGALRGKATKLCQVASLQGCTLLLLLNFDHPFARPAWVASGTVLSWLYRSC